MVDVTNWVWLICNLSRGFIPSVNCIIGSRPFIIGYTSYTEKVTKETIITDMTSWIVGQAKWFALERTLIDVSFNFSVRVGREATGYATPLYDAIPAFYPYPQTDLAKCKPLDFAGQPYQPDCTCIIKYSVYRWDMLSFRSYDQFNFIFPRDEKLIAQWIKWQINSGIKGVLDNSNIRHTTNIKFKFTKPAQIAR